MANDIADVFRTFDTSVVSDALDEHGIDGVITGIEPADATWTAVGRVHPMRFEEASDPGTETNFPFAMLRELAPGRVLFVAGAGSEVSHWGANASRLAANAGANGVVVDGGFRDVPAVRNGPFPVFGRVPTPRTGQGRITVDGVDEPVEIDGIAVAPDDVVIADATGVVVVPSDEAAAVADTAESILAEELLLERKIANGATVEDLQGSGHSF